MRRSKTWSTTETKLPQLGWKRRQEVHERSDWRCWFCGRDFRSMSDGPPYRADTPILDIPTVEHLIPQCRGGTSSPENLVTACKSCNTAKRYRTVEEYRAYLVSLTLAGQAQVALQQLIDDCWVDESVYQAMAWIEEQLPTIVFYGERNPSMRD